MRLALLVAVSALALGCSGLTPNQADDINARLTRIEGRLDELAVVTRNERTESQPSHAPLLTGLMVRRGDYDNDGDLDLYVVGRDQGNGGVVAKVLAVASEIKRLREAGYTDGYPPMQQLVQELKTLAARLPASSSSDDSKRRKH